MLLKNPFHRRLTLGVGFLSISIIHSSACAEPVTTRWSYPVTGVWSDAELWSTLPFYPNNGSPAGTTYDVVVDAIGGDYQVQILPDYSGTPPHVVDTLTIDSPNATIAIEHDLTVLGDVNLNAGQITHTWKTVTVFGQLNINGGTYAPSGGTIASTVIGGSGGLFQLLRNSTLDHVTLKRDLYVPPQQGGTSARNGLVLEGTTLRLASQMTLESGTITGDGEILFEGSGLTTFGGTTIGPDIAIRTTTAGGALTGPVRIKGMVSSQTPGENIRLSGATIDGLLEARNGGTVDGRSANYNTATDSLDGGRWHMYPGSKISFGGPVSVSSADIFIAGARDNHWNPDLSALQHNAGTLTLTDGASLDVGGLSGFTNTGTVNIAPGSTLAPTWINAASGAWNVAGSLALTFGTTHLTAGINWDESARLNVFFPAIIELDGDMGSASQAPLSVEISSAGPHFFNETQHLKSLLIHTGANVNLSGSGQLLRTRSLTIEGSGRLDLGENSLILDATDLTMNDALSAIEELIGLKVGPLPRLRSSLSATDPHRGLAAIVNREISGAALVAEFAGDPVDHNSILIAYTLNGDSDLDFRITSDDYKRIDRGFLGQSSDPSLITYRFGDFNYNDTINLDDYALIDAAFLSQFTTPFTPIPEPATLLLLPAILLLTRRRRRTAC